MKAIIYTKYGSPDELQLQEVEKPTPADEEAATVPAAGVVALQNLRGVGSTSPSFLLSAKGEIQPGQIGRRYPLNEVPAALRYLEAGHARGKVVITVQ